MPSRYRILKKLGQGGMGEVFEAELLGAEGFKRRLALKRIHSDWAGDDGSRKAFIQEARICAQLDHRNIVRVFDFESDRGSLGLVMEYVEGMPLSAVMKARTASFPEHTALHLLREMLVALCYAHEKTDERGNALRIVHRDIKPSNILVDREGGTKLMDFGLALFRDRVTDETKQGVKGTASYMSPEQAQGRRLDQRTDLFSLGIIFWELLTGHRLFTGASIPEVLYAVCSQPIIPPQEYKKGLVSEAVGEFSMSLLERDLGKRFKTAREALGALRLLGRDLTEESLKAQQMLSSCVSEMPLRWASGIDELESSAGPAGEESGTKNERKPISEVKALVPHDQPKREIESPKEQDALSVHWRISEGPKSKTRELLITICVGLALIASLLLYEVSKLPERDEYPQVVALRFAKPRYRVFRLIPIKKTPIKETPKPLHLPVKKRKEAPLKSPKKPETAKMSKEERAVWERIQRRIERDRLVDPP